MKILYVVSKDLDATEQKERFEVANRIRVKTGKASLPLDHRFLNALEGGLPACAGVAVGLDRVIMLASGASSIDEVLTFTLEEA